MLRSFWGPLSPLGLSVAALTILADQVHKAWMIYVYDITTKGVVTITPFFDLVLLWNPAASYGLFGWFGSLGLILFAFAATLGLIVWLAQVTSPLSAVAIGFIIGGAMGNAIDRIAYGAVADFFAFHAFGFEWYVFNIADVAIVAGVVGLLYDLLIRGHKKAGNPSKM